MSTHIELPIFWFASGQPTWRIVDAEIIDPAPHLASVASFAVHRSPVSALLWRITNIETGLFVSEGDTRDEAVTNAILRLCGRTTTDVLRAYADNVQLYPEMYPE
ncbi:MAG: hypothetical protein ACYDBH_24395, partial [Acidobacteriaceae bacterium]